MHKPYNERASLAIIGIIGCVALWAVVIAFSLMSEEMARLQKDVDNLKVTTSSGAHTPVAPAPVEQKTQKYSNDQYGFSFEYPLGWFVKDGLARGNKLQLSDDSSFSQGAPLSLSVVPLSQAKELMKQSGSEMASSEESVLVGSIPSTLVTYDGEGGWPNLAYFIPISKSNVVVVWTGPVGKNPAISSVNARILNTFKAK